MTVINFAGRGRPGPALKERDVLEMIMILPGVKAAKFHQGWADLLVRLSFSLKTKLFSN